MPRFNEFTGVEDQFGLNTVSTEDAVWKYMTEYQAANDRPPSMDEIKDHAVSLNYRSSVREALLSLHSKGLVKIVGEEGESRRHIAIEYDATLDRRNQDTGIPGMIDGGFWIAG